MIRFVQCTYDEYQYIWLKERVNNFLVKHYDSKKTIDQLVDQFLSSNQNQNREAVQKIVKQILEKL